MSVVFDSISIILLLITMQSTKDDFLRELSLVHHTLTVIFSVFHFNYDAALSAEITNQRMLRNNKGMSYMKFLQMWSVLLKFIEPLLSLQLLIQLNSIIKRQNRNFFPGLIKDINLLLQVDNIDILQPLFYAMLLSRSCSGDAVYFMHVPLDINISNYKAIGQ